MRTYITILTKKGLLEKMFEIIESLNILLSSITDIYAQLPTQTTSSNSSPPEISSDWTEWFKTIIAASIGGLISGIFLLFKDSLSHKRIEQERYKKLLADRRIEVYDNLIKELNGLWFLYSPIGHGIEPLRFVKDAQTSPKFFEGDITPEKKKSLDDERTLAKDIHEKMKNLNRFMMDNALVIGQEVKKVWAEYFRGGLGMIKIRAGRKEGEFYVPEAWQRCVDEFEEKLDNAISSDLKETGYRPSQVKATKDLIIKGQENAKKLMEKIKSEDA